MQAAASVWVVDDDDAVRDSFEALLIAAGFAVRGFADATSFLADFDAAKVACVLLDVRLPDADGVGLHARLNQQADLLTPVILLTGHGNVAMAVEAMRNGAFDFLEKPYDPEKLVDRVRAAVRWGVEERRERLQNEAAVNRLRLLTPREADVMRQLVIGRSNKTIARELGLSPRTVEIHRARVMEKTGAESLPHLVRMAMVAGIEPKA